MQPDPVFQSFFMGGFECSSHIRRDRHRLDLIAATHHDQHALSDYQALQRHRINTIRDGLRWHLIERIPGQYDFSSLLPLVRAAQVTGMQVIWDVCHYGWPNDLDIWSPQFVTRYAAFARATASFIKQELDGTPFYAPINEISFLAWAGGDVAFFNPHAQGRGLELKAQLVRAAIAGIEAIWSIDPRARIVHADPVIHVVADRHRQHEQLDADRHCENQFQAWDMLCGRSWPQLGGDPRYLDILGVNYYSNNQWINGGSPFDRFHPQYRWFSQLLGDLYARYNRPLFVAETGCEGEARAEWLTYISREVRLAMNAGVPVGGICLYPVLDYPGWDDDRHCRTGLLGYASAIGERVSDVRFANALAKQQMQFGEQPTSPILENNENKKRTSLPTLCLYTESTTSDMGETMLALAGKMREEFRVSLVCPDEGTASDLLRHAVQSGIQTFALPLQPSGPIIEVLRHWLRTNPPGIFHCHAGTVLEGLQGITVAHALGIRSIIRTEYASAVLNNEQQQQDYQRAIAVVDRLICVGEVQRDTMRELYYEHFKGFTCV